LWLRTIYPYSLKADLPAIYRLCIFDNQLLLRLNFHFYFLFRNYGNLPFFLNRNFIARILFFKLLFSDNRFSITVYYHRRILILFFYLADLAALPFPLNTMFALFIITPFQLLTGQITSRAAMLREKQNRPSAVLLI
jgi:hypothetical protein